MVQILPAEGVLQNGIFAYPVRVYYEDTDAGGIVYYANYLKFAERARSEFLRALGVNQQKILAEQQAGFVVRSCHIEYLQSAVLDDALTVTCEVAEMGGACMILKQKICRDDAVLAQIEVKVIFVSLATHCPTRILPEIKEKFSLVNGVKNG